MNYNFNNFGIIANTDVSPNAFLINEVANQNTQTAINSIMSNPYLTEIERSKAFGEMIFADFNEKYNCY